MKKYITIILIISFTYAQNIGSIFSKETTDNNTGTAQLNRDNDLTNIANLTYTPIEKSINPDTYILGPGDLLEINILSIKNISLPIRINPVGEIMIPSVGILDVNGISLTEARIKIGDYITETALKNAIVNVTLLDIRRIKIQVLGAIHNPGFIYISAMDKIYDAIIQSGGVQNIAHPDIVQIIRGEDTINVKLKEYLSGIDTSQNVALKSGDIIIVPLSEYANSLGLTSGEYNNHQVVVYGFVNQNGGSNSFRYYPGYTARDYIAMAGGIKEQDASFKSGNINETMIYRSDGSIIKNAIDEIVLPGDMIEVPSSLPVVVYGFVNQSGGSNLFRYYPGYTARDYIAMAGGTKEQGSSFRSGNINKTTIYRSDGTKIKNAVDEFVLPGDMIKVAPSVLYQIVSGDGIIRMLSTLASIGSSAYIIYLVTQEK
jgi:protein involved in polysaccharide export with SLBB domain